MRASSQFPDLVGPAKFNDVVIPAQAGIYGALASADWISRVVAASREHSMDSHLRGNDELFESCGADNMTYLVAEACALTPH